MRWKFPVLSTVLKIERKFVDMEIDILDEFKKGFQEDEKKP